MKFKKIVFVLWLLFPIFSSCNYSSDVNVFVYYKVAEECSSMGKISGEVRQKPFVGDYTTSVTAVPNDGYEFVEWNDKLTSLSRSDKATENIETTYIAYFKLKA